MATASLFYKEDGYFVGAITFDLLTAESHSLESQVSEHPVENGATVSDHVRQLPRKGSLTGLVSNFPLVNTPTLPAAFLEKMYAAGRSNFVESLVASYGAPFGYNPSKDKGPTAADFAALARPANRAADTWSLFQVLMAAKEPVTISTGLERYRDVMVTKVLVDRDASTGEALSFRVEFQEFSFVTLTDVEMTTTTKPMNLGTDANKQAMPKAKKGKTGGKARVISQEKLPTDGTKITAMGITK